MTYLMQTLPIIAKMLGDKFGVKVEIGEYHPATDGKTIYLPRLPIDDKRTEVLLRGFIDHEAAHVRFQTGLLSGTPLEAALQNILEDIRIETAMSHIFPGTAQNLDRLTRQLVAEQRFERIPDEAHPGAIVQAFLLHRLRADVLQQSALDDLATDSERRFHETFTPGKATRIEALARTATDCGSFDEIRELVTRILKSFQEDDTAESGDSESAGDGTDRIDTDEEPANSFHGDSESESVDGSASSGASASPDETPQSEPSSKAAHDVAEAIQQALDADVSDLSEDMGNMLSDELSDAASDERKRIGVAQDKAGSIDPQAYLSEIGSAIDEQRARRATNALKSRLHGLVQASRLNRQPPRRHGRRLDANRLSRLACRDTRVFRAQREQPGVNTAVHLLMDRSGSMSDSMQLANETMFASALALESISRVCVETCVFPVENSNVATLTPFGRRVVPGDYAVRASGGTPMAEALWHVASALVARSETRKISVVITDGSPSDSARACEIIDMMQKAGIEVIGIGINTMSVSTLFPKSEVIDSVELLPTAVFKLLEQPLLAQSA